MISVSEAIKIYKDIVYSSAVEETKRSVYSEMEEEFDTNEVEDFKSWKYANDRLHDLSSTLQTNK